MFDDILDNAYCSKYHRLTHFLDALLTGDSLAGPLSGSRVALGTLTSDGQAFPMPDSPVTANVAQARDILRYLASQLTLNNIIAVYNLGDAAQLILAKALCLCGRFNLGFFEDLF
jgi:hypothetical protein